MTYRILGLDPLHFAHLIGASDQQLASHNAVRVTAHSDRGFPCRVSLEDARAPKPMGKTASFRPRIKPGSSCAFGIN